MTMFALLVVVFCGILAVISTTADKSADAAALLAAANFVMLAHLVHALGATP